MGGAGNLRLRIVLHSSSLLKKWQPSLEHGIFSSSQDISVAIYPPVCLVADLKRRKDFLYLLMENAMGSPLSCPTYLYCLFVLCRHLVVNPCALWKVLSFH